MQRLVAGIAPRFLYSTNPLFEAGLKAYHGYYMYFNPNDTAAGSAEVSIAAAGSELKGKDGAFVTVVQWLYHRINATR